MNVLYACDNEGPTVMPLDTLMRNFTVTNSFERHLTEDEIRFELINRGWFEGLHINGKYLIVSLDKFDKQICPTPEAWDNLVPHDTFQDVLDELASCDGAILYWQTDARRYKAALAAGVIKEDGELLVHPDAICVEEGMAYVMPEKKS